VTTRLEQGHAKKIFLPGPPGRQWEQAVAQSSSSVVTALLAKWHAGDQTALEELIPVVYGELRHVAHRYLRRERPGHTLESTALVHEAYLRLRAQGHPEFENRAHFVSVAAYLMRQILVEYARRRNASKRDGGHRVVLEDQDGFCRMKNVDLEVLDDALKELARLDPRQSRVVELRFFGGLSIEETAAVLGISPRTVKRDWATARVWLHHEVN
jgi:RNA polymerase sigma factor (TIGR02999 family)